MLDAIKDYHTVIAEIATLMEELSAFLERIDAIIGDGLDKRLRTTVSMILHVEVVLTSSAISRTRSLPLHHERGLSDPRKLAE